MGVCNLRFLYDSWRLMAGIIIDSDLKTKLTTGKDPVITSHRNTTS